MTMMLKETNCFRPIKRKHGRVYSQLGGRLKYRLLGTNIFLVYYPSKYILGKGQVNEGWRWFRARTNYTGEIIEFFDATPEELFDDPDTPVELLFHLDLITSLEIRRV
jgi:hypothetical protein